MSWEGIVWEDWISWDRSMRTGGVESPVMFKAVSVYPWDRVVKEWMRNGMGYELETPIQGGTHLYDERSYAAIGS
eukprot:7666563-Pyramimonas_sp.AAC.1